VLTVGAATAVALVSRALLTIGDLLAAALAAWSGRRAARNPATHAGPLAQDAGRSGRE
jgi:hypothetical protein